MSSKWVIGGFVASIVLAALLVVQFIYRDTISATDVVVVGYTSTPWVSAEGDSFTGLFEYLPGENVGRYLVYPHAPVAVIAEPGALLPDRSGAAVLQDTGDGIAVVVYDFKTQTIVETLYEALPGTVFSHFVWGPDAAYLAFRVTSPSSAFSEVEGESLETHAPSQERILVVARDTGERTSLGRGFPVAFSSEDDVLFFEDDALTLFTHTGELIPLSTVTEETLREVHASPDGQYIAVTLTDGQASLYRMAWDTQELTTVATFSDVTAIRFVGDALVTLGEQAFHYTLTELGLRNKQALSWNAALGEEVYVLSIYTQSNPLLQ